MKRLLILAAAAGAGACLMAALILAGVSWYRSRPKPPPPQIPWNATGIVGREPPGFGIVKRESKPLLSLSFPVENKTGRDYEFDMFAVKLMLKLKDGSLTGPIQAENGMLLEAAFIPANQRGRLHLLMRVTVPEKSPAESDKDYHEKLRAHLNEHHGNISGFVVYDTVNHFEIDLPRWRSEPQPGEENSLPEAGSQGSQK